MDTSLASNSEGSQQENALTEEGLVRALESGQISLSSVVKNVYATRNLDSVLTQIEARVAVHDSEMKRVADKRYNDFMEGMRDLSTMRESVIHLKSDVLEVNAEIKAAVNKAISQVDDLNKQRKYLLNAFEAVDVVEQCIPALRLYCKLKTQMTEKKYYVALKTLEQLETTYLPALADIRFAQTLSAMIPNLRDDIKERSLDELREFLAGARQHAELIGQETMFMVSKDMKDMGVEEDIVLLEKGARGSGVFTGPADVINYMAVFRCYHICAALGSRDFVIKYYHTQRTTQCRQTCNRPEILETLESFKEYYSRVIGFFAIEAYLSSIFPELVTSADVKRLWTAEARQRVENAIRKGLQHATDATTLLKIKLLTIVCARSLELVGLNCKTLLNCLFELRDTYTQLLMNSFKSRIQQIVSDDTYSPLIVEDKSSFNVVCSKFPFKNPAMEKTDFPRRFPFSSMVVLVYEELQQYMHSCKTYVDNLGMYSVHIDAIVCSCVNTLTANIIRPTFRQVLQEKTLTLPQVVQLLINLACLEDSCYHLEKYASTVIFGGGGAEHQSSTRRSETPPLSGKRSKQSSGGRSSPSFALEQQRFQIRLDIQTMFREVGRETEQKLRGLLNSKIDEFFELAEYDWAAKGTSSGKPSSYMVDMLAFLKVIIQTVHAMAPQFSQSLLAETCRHISECMVNFLVDSNVKQITEESLHLLNLDLMQADAFVSEMIPQSSSSDLLLAGSASQQHFVEMRQLLDLLLTGNWQGYFDEIQLPATATSSVERKFAKISLDNLLVIVEKMKDKRAFSLKKSDRDRQLDNVLAQLREIKASTITI